MRKGWWLGIWVAAALPWGCSQAASDEPVGRATHALKVKVSPELVLSKAASRLGGGGQRPVVACGRNECVIAYEAELEGHVEVFATRVSAAGVALDVPAVHLAEKESVTDLSIASAGAGKYLVAWGDFGGTFAVSFDAATQTVGDREPLSDELSTDVHAYSDGASFLVSYLQGALNHYRLLKDGALGAEKDLTFTPSDAASAPGQYALVFGAHLQRIDSASGDAIDPALVTLSKYVSYQSIIGSAHVAYAGGNYVVTWATSSDLLTLRMRASDGVVLDADDDFNQVSKANSVCNGCFNGIEMGVFDATSKGSEVLVSFAHRAPNSVEGTPSTFKTLHVDPSTGQSVPASSVHTLCVMDLDEAFAFELGSSLGSCVTATQVQALQYTTQPFGLTLGVASSFGFSGRTDTEPVVASDGTTFAVAWHFCAANLCGVRLTRVDAETGAALDDPPLVIADKPVNAVTLSGHVAGYVVGWKEAGELRARAVTSAGVLGNVLTLSTELVTGLKSACNDQYCSLGYEYGEQLGLVRVDTAVTGQMAANVSLYSSSGGFALAGDTTPAADARTFMAFFHSGNNLKGARFRSASATLLQNTTVGLAASASEPILSASNGTQLVITFVDNEQHFVATEVDPVSGNGVSGSPHLLYPLPSDTNAVALWHDGKSYGLLLSRHDEDGDHQRVVRFADDFTLLDNGVSVLTTLEKSYGPTQVAGLGNGRSLAAYAVNDYPELGRLIHARFLDNDGIAAPPEGAGGQGQAEGGEATSPAAGGDTTNDGGQSALPGAGQGSGARAGSNVGGSAGKGSADGGSSAQAGQPSGAKSADSSGCGCKVAGSSPAGQAGLPLLALLGLAGVRRRGRARGPRR